jgi:hypothetical protein
MSRESLGQLWRRLPHPVRWVGVVAAGSASLVAGAAMLVLPGPGLLLIVIGLMILATEFTWADSLRLRMVQRGLDLRSRLSKRAAASRTTVRVNQSSSPDERNY